ncbi:MAG: hypothetical protein ACLGH7_02565 [Actinomycetes bacterium]
MTQTASSPLGSQLTAPLPGAGTADAGEPVQGLAEAAGLVGPLAAGPLAAGPLASASLAAPPDAGGQLAAGPLSPELDPDLGLDPALELGLALGLDPALGLGAAAGLEDESDVLSVVWRASSHLESMQWELDNAQEALRQAVRTACSAGIAQDEVCAAAHLTTEELAAVLRPAPEGPAGIQL